MADALNDMIDAIRANHCHGLEWLCGSRDEIAIADTAEAWLFVGFTPTDASAWWRAGAFCPDAAAELRDLDLTPYECGADYGVVSIAYAVSNGDLAAADAAGDKYCECGLITAEVCGTRLDENRVDLEWIPPHLRSSHEAADNRGIYPHNGAQRLTVTDGCAENLLDDWTYVVGSQ